jgi:CRP-like cAMP-binding protein
MHKPDRTATMLRSIPGLSALSDRELGPLVALVDEFHLDAGATLTRQGCAARQAFLVVDGTARVDVDGVTVAEIGPGEFVGEMGLLRRGVRSATVTATTPMRVLVLGPYQFDAFVSHPGVARAMAAQLAARLRRADAAAFAAAS